MPKKEIHPKWFDDAEIYCDGQLVMKTSSTKSRLNILEADNSVNKSSITTLNNNVSNLRYITYGANQINRNNKFNKVIDGSACVKKSKNIFNQIF